MTVGVDGLKISLCPILRDTPLVASRQQLGEIYATFMRRGFVNVVVEVVEVTSESSLSSHVFDTVDEKNIHGLGRPKPIKMQR
uniref:NDK domain-containing protein n=1 Tax=Ascaris lumbricoides TaxID=6252 RepID=A0A0M3HSA6_ASCLU